MLRRLEHKASAPTSERRWGLPVPQELGFLRPVTALRTRRGRGVRRRRYPQIRAAPRARKGRAAGTLGPARRCAGHPRRCPLLAGSAPGPWRGRGAGRADCAGAVPPPGPGAAGLQGTHPVRELQAGKGTARGSFSDRPRVSPRPRPVLAPRSPRPRVTDRQQ